MTDLTIVRTAEGLISLSFWCGFEIVNTVEFPQYVNYACTCSHKTCPFDKIGREFGLQTEIIKGEINHSEITEKII